MIDCKRGKEWTNAASFQCCTSPASLLGQGFYRIQPTDCNHMLALNQLESTTSYSAWWLFRSILKIGTQAFGARGGSRSLSHHGGALEDADTQLCSVTAQFSHLLEQD